ncbi:MAG: 2OG-Fe(II) oxygenase family protein [Pseudomonadales bacterium]|jgi:isopenicillin N synthase-like dioxygenase|nr:2OG-Fe(II) oxygenase family protein [Pseudomonadales bacterium]
MQSIPVIDFKAFKAGGLAAIDQEALVEACEDHGFFLLSNHGCETQVNDVFAAAEEFFAMPREQKVAVYRDAENPLGYYDRELTKQRRDQKEVFDFKAGGHISKNPLRHTRWPVQPATFRPALTEFFAAFTDLSEATMGMVLAALGLPADVVATTMETGFGAAHTSAARLNHYPAKDPVPASERGSVTPLGDMALHHHTDPGAITLLLQDDCGGLQARSRSHGWIDVPPSAGTIVVNIGDILQVWTNDRCTAGVHRVVPITSPNGRFSIPFFYQPKVDALVEPWLAGEETPRYRAFSWQEYIRGRVTDNYSDIGEEDIQIDRYKVA